MALERHGAQHQMAVVDKWAAPTTTYQMTTRDYVLRPDATAAGFTVTLPPVALAKGRFYSIIAQFADSSNPITITAASSEGWKGDQVLYAKGEGQIFYSDGMKWCLRELVWNIVDTQTSGWPAGLFISTALTGAGGSFTALQGDAILTAAKATVTGIENWMQINTGGRVTGACRSVQGTIDFSNEDKGSGGVYLAACFNIKGEGAACDIGTTQRVACIELKTEGTFSAVAGENFQTKAAGYAIYINGFTAAAGVTNILSSTSLAELPAGTLGLRVGVGTDAASGTAYYIPLVVATAWN